MASGFDKHQPIAATPLADLLGIHREAVDRALTEVRPLSNEGITKYPLGEAIRVVLTIEKPKLDANYERARKDKELADKTAIENARSREELAPVETMAETLDNIIANFRSLLRGDRKIPQELRERVFERLAESLEKEAE